MRLPFVSRYQAERLEERRQKLWDELHVEKNVSGDLRRQVRSLKLENTEFRRQLGERSERETALHREISSLEQQNARLSRQLEEQDAGKPNW